MINTKDTPKLNKTRRRGGLVALTLLLLLLAAAAGGAFFMTNRPVDAPPWLRAKIEERIAQTIPGIDVQFGRMSLLVQRTGLARIILWDVNILNNKGGQIAALSDIEAGLSPTALLRGKLELREAQVSGAFVTLQRDESGRVALALGDVFASNTKMPGIPQILAQVDRALLDPRFAHLKVFEADALTLRFEDKRARQGWTADGGRLRLERKGGNLSLTADVALLGGGDGVATVALEAKSTIGVNDLSFGVLLSDLGSTDIATQSPALAWLDELQAPISGKLRSKMREDGSLGPLTASLEIGQGVLQPNSATRAVPFDGARTAFTYLPDQALLTFDEISVRSSLGRIKAEGTAQLQGLEAGWPTALIGQFRLSDIALAKGTLFERALDVSGAEMAFKLQLKPFRLSLGQFRVTDPDFPLFASGELAARSNGWAVSLDALADRTDAEQVLSFWPTQFKEKPRKWVSENIKGGTLRDAVFALRAEPQAKPETYIDFRFEDGHSSYNRALAPITGGVGRLMIYNGRLSTRLDAGEIDLGKNGILDVAGSEFIIPDLKQKPATGILNLTANGPVKAALAYLDNDTWRILRKAGRSIDVATGQAAVSGQVVLPLVKGTKFKDVSLDLTGVIRDVKSDQLVPNRVLASDRLALRINSKSVSLEGPVRLSGVDATGRWEQSLQGGGGMVTANVDVTPNALGNLGITLPDGMVSGQGSAQFEMALTKGKPPEFTVTSGLAGIGLALPSLGWKLPQASSGSFEIAGRFAKPVEIDGLSLTAAGLDMQAGLKLAPAGGFERLTVGALTLDSWLDIAGVLRSRGAGKAPALEVTSGTVDLRQAAFGSGGQAAGAEPGGPKGGPLAVTLERLQVTDTIVLQKFRGNFDLSNGLEGRFDASLGKGADIEGRVLPQNGRSAFRITGEDAGDILLHAGFLKTVSDGTFALDMAPVKGTTGSYDGKLVIKETRLRQAPAIGALIDAISIVGLLDQLNGQGIFFADVEANFRLTPNQVILRDASAVGPSMGISMDGFYDLGSGRMDMQGVLSPIYFVNGIGRLISRRGEGLIGFNFNLSGLIKNPQVAVNPLSVFTPGMFRDIFHRPPPQVSQ